MTDKTPHDRGRPTPRSTAPGWLLLPAPALLLWGWALWEAPAGQLTPILAAGGLTLTLLVACALLLDHRDRSIRALRCRIDRIRTEAGTLAEQDLPRVISRLRGGESSERVLYSLPVPAEPSERALLEVVVHEIADAEQRRAATVTACATAAGRIQALTTTMLADLRHMQEQHGEGAVGADVLGDLMHLDHITAQAGRTADSIAVLTGARSGRRWARAISLESVVRGAMSRIGGYQRVRLHNVSEQSVAGFAAEGIIHALAEILDNAAKFSPPTSAVHVHVEEAQAGIAIMVEDGGLIMGEEALERARRAVTEGLDIRAIAGTRLGLSVVGQIARRYDLSVSFRSSSRGGTAVVLFLPQKLVKPIPTPPRTDLQAVSMPEPSPAAPFESSVPRPEPADRPRPQSADDLPRHTSGLPMRRRGRTLATTQRPDTERTTTPGPTTSAQGFGAFRSAVRGQEPTETPKDG